MRSHAHENHSWPCWPFFSALPSALGSRLRIETAPWNPDVERTEATAAPRPPARRTGAQGRRRPKQLRFRHARHGVRGSHEFVFTNAGKAPLKLAAGETSCRCTMSKLAQRGDSAGRLDQGHDHLEAQGSARPLRADGQDTDQRSGAAAGHADRRGAGHRGDANASPARVGVQPAVGRRKLRPARRSCCCYLSGR